MRLHFLFRGALMAGVLTSSLTDSLADPVPSDAPSQDVGLRTDRLSAKRLKRWKTIERLALAEDDRGQPLHPTLYGMWREVASSGHEIYVELPERRRSVSIMAGQFLVESVDSDGHIVAVVRLNLETIDRFDPRQKSSHDGFRRFRGLGREGRYVEVLGHELGHAVWTLADVARARSALQLQKQQLVLARSLPRAASEERPEIRRQLRSLDAHVEALEVPAREVEARVWEELVASQVARGAKKAR